MKRKHSLALLLALLMLLNLCACGGSAKTMPSQMQVSTNDAISERWDTGSIFDTNFLDTTSGSSYDSETTYSPPQEPGSPSSPDMEPSNGDTQVYDSEMKIIKTGDISIQSKTFDETDSFIKKHTEELGGLLTDRSISGTPGYRSGSYTVRIPSKNFDEFFYQISGAWTVTNQQITSEDVTEQYSDLELRLETNRAKHERLLKLLDKAETLTDIYSIQTELSQVEYEIDSITGTLNHLSSRIAYSTVYISVREVESEPIMDDGSFWSELSASLSNGWRSFTERIRYFTVDLAYELPNIIFNLLILAIVIFVGIKVYKFIRHKTKGVKVPKPSLKKKSEEPGEQTGEQDAAKENEDEK